MAPHPPYSNQLQYYYNSTTTNQLTNNYNGNILQTPLANVPVYQNTSFIYSKSYPTFDYSMQFQQASQQQQPPLVLIQPQLTANANGYPISPTYIYPYAPAFIPKLYQPVFTFSSRTYESNISEHQYENNRNRSASTIETTSPSCSSSV